MANNLQKSRKSIYIVSGITLVLIALAAVSKVIFKGNLKVGKYGK